MVIRHQGQVVSAKPRTEDVRINEDISFKTMLLPKPILKGLKKARYITPSPIQKKALPLVRCGLDLIVQAKAGTGKTCVFTVAALEMVQPELSHLQALILAPTREVALQITDVVNTLGSEIHGLKTSCFIGGYPVKDDEKNAGCHIAVGTPGRLRQLIELKTLKVKHVRLYVMDEVDKLMEDGFIPDIKAIYKSLPYSKQVLVFSATYTPELIDQLAQYMHRGQYITPQCTANPTVLLGVRQLVSVLPLHVDRLATLRLKERKLLEILRSVPFNQCLVFSNVHSRAQSVCVLLRKQGFGADWIAGRQQQTDRVIALAQLREQRVRILVTTDLTARGIDVENVNLVINLDLPLDHHTYLHRMGRAGRYGSHGMVITIISAQELPTFRKLLGAIGGTSLSVGCVPEDLKTVDLRTVPEEELEHIHGTEEEEKAEVSEESDNSTDTEEKLSKDSSSCGSHVKEEHNDAKHKTVLMVNGGKINSDVEESDGSTDTDEKLSKESSSDDDQCDAKEKPTVEETQCCCGLYQVQPSDLETISQPSLFAAGVQEDHWMEVLPVVISEKRIPLNTKLALIGSKFVRIRSLDTSKNKLELPTEDFEISELMDLRRENTPTKDIPSFEDLIADIEEASEKCDGVNEDLQEEKYYTENVSVCKEENDVASKLEQIKAQLDFCKRTQEKQESFFRRFDSFDVVGWVAVDAQDNILEHLYKEEIEVFQFNLRTCAGGKSHIVVQSLSETRNEEDVRSCDDHVMTFNLEKFNLDYPTSLHAIADKFKALDKTGKIDPETPEISKQNSEVNHKLNSSAEKGTNNSKATQNRQPPKLVNGTKNPQQNGHCKINGVMKGSKSKPKIVEPSNTADKNESKPMCNGARKKDLPTNSSASPSSNSNDKSKSKNVKKKSIESSDPDMIYNDKEPNTKASVSLSRDLRKSSAGTEDSGPYIDMSHNLRKWQELHDFEESDSETSSESDLLNPSWRVRESYTDSSECSYETSQAIKQREVLSRLSKSKTKKQSNKARKTPQLGTTESYDTVESENSNRHSFKTATSQNLSLENIEEQKHKPHSYYDFSHYETSQRHSALNENRTKNSHRLNDKSKSSHGKSYGGQNAQKEFSKNVQTSQSKSLKTQSYQIENSRHRVSDDRYSRQNICDAKNLKEKKTGLKHKEKSTLNKNHPSENVFEPGYVSRNVLDPGYVNQNYPDSTTFRENLPDPTGYFSQNVPDPRYFRQNLPNPMYLNQNLPELRYLGQTLPNPRYFGQNCSYPSHLRQNTSDSRHFSENSQDPRHSRKNNQTRQTSSHFRRSRDPKILTSNNLFADWCSTWYAEMRQRAQQLEFAEYINSMTSNL